MNATEATLTLEIPDVAPVTPTLFIVLAQYSGPGPANGTWKVMHRLFLSQVGAENWATENLNKWWVRRKIYRLA